MAADITPKDSTAWRIQTWIAFLISTGMLLGGIVLLPIDLWTKGYLLMGALFMLGSTVSLVKTLRDAHETSAYHKRLEHARSARLLKEFELENAGAGPGR